MECKRLLHTCNSGRTPAGVVSAVVFGLIVGLSANLSLAQALPDLSYMRRIAMLETIKTMESGSPIHHKDDVEGDGGIAIGRYQVQIATAATELDVCKLKAKPGCPLTPSERAWLKHVLLDPQINLAVANLKLDHCERLGYQTAASKLGCYRSRSDHAAYVTKAMPLYRSAIKRLKRGE